MYLAGPGFACAPLGVMVKKTESGFYVLIGNRDVTNRIREKGKIKIKSSYGQRDMLDLTIVDLTQSIHFQPGEPAYVKLDGSILFGGSVEEIREQEPDSAVGEMTEITVKAVDFNALLDRFLVSSVYEDMTLAEIIENIIETTPLGVEGIELGICPVTDTIDKVVFQSVTVNEVLRDLGKLTGLSNNVDYNKKLNFFDKSTYEAPYKIGTGGVGTYRKMIYSRKRSKYRNRQVLRAGNDRTDTLTETVRGDASLTKAEDRSRTFQVSYPIAEIISVKRNDVPQRVGVREIDEDKIEGADWKQWFFSYGSREISQNSEKDENVNPTLTHEDRLEINYVGLYPMTLEVEDYTNINERMAIEGGSGVYSVREDDTSIDGRDFATEKANRLLEIYGKMPITLNYELLQLGLVSGQIMSGVTIPEHGISNANYLIDEVEITFQVSGVYVVRVKMVEGERQEAWSDYFRRLSEAGRKTTIRANEVAIRQIALSDESSVTDAILDSVNNSVTLIAFSADPMSWALLRSVMVAGTGEVYFSMRVGRSRIGDPYGAT